MRLYRGSREEVPTGDYRIEIGKGTRVQEGNDVTIFAWGAMIPLVMKVSEKMKKTVFPVM